jgi:hypothetical protein
MAAKQTRPMLVCADALIDHIFFFCFVASSVSHMSTTSRKMENSWSTHSAVFFLFKKQPCIIKELSLIYIFRLYSSKLTFSILNGWCWYVQVGSIYFQRESAVLFNTRPSPRLSPYRWSPVALALDSTSAGRYNDGKIKWREILECFKFTNTWQFIKARQLTNSHCV